MPVGKKGSKGSSPKVYKYFKIDGDKTTKLKKVSVLYGQSVGGMW